VSKHESDGKKQDHKLNLLNLLNERYKINPGRFVNKSTISVELDISEEDAFRYADYLVNNNWAIMSEPDFKSWRVMINDEGIKELEKMKQTITKDMKEHPDKKDKSGVRLEKLQNQIGEKKMEAERRKAVVETKKLGAEIEIITMLRQELKRRDEDTKKIPEMQKQLDKIEGMLNKLTTEQPTEQSTTKFQEDVMYKELMAATENEILSTRVNARKNAKKCYFKIKSLRRDISNLGVEIDRAMGIHRRQELAKIRDTRRNELDVCLNELSEYWSEFT